MRLWLVRHALTHAEPGLCYGRTDVGVPAEATETVAHRIVPELPPGIALVTSPLQRCADLARAIAAGRPDIVARVDPRLAEMDFGAWEGTLWSAIDRGAFDAWTGDFADASAGGDGESIRRFMQRVGAAFDEWRDGGVDALWVTHAGVMRAVCLLQTGLRCPERADQWPAQPIAYGECLKIELA